MLNIYLGSIDAMIIWTLEQEAGNLKRRFIGVNKAQFARDNKIAGGASMVSQHISGNRPISLESAIAYANGFKCALNDISPRYAMQIEAAMYVSAPELGMSERLPMVGTAQLGDDGYWAELEYPAGFGDGYIEYSSTDKQAFALRCKGESMKPRIKPDEFVIVEPNHNVVNGDEVLIKGKEGRVMVKELLYIRDGVVHLGSVNEKFPKITIPLDHVESMQYVAAIAKSTKWKPNL